MCLFGICLSLSCLDAVERKRGSVQVYSDKQFTCIKSYLFYLIIFLFLCFHKNNLYFKVHILLRCQSHVLMQTVHTLCKNALLMERLFCAPFKTVWGFLQTVELFTVTKSSWFLWYLSINKTSGYLWLNKQLKPNLYRSVSRFALTRKHINSRFCFVLLCWCQFCKAILSRGLHNILYFIFSCCKLENVLKNHQSSCYRKN